jgi:hypothetical protein
VPTTDPTDTQKGPGVLYLKGDYGFDNLTIDLNTWTYEGTVHYPFNPHTITVSFYDENKFKIGKTSDLRSMNWHLWAGSPEDVRAMKGNMFHSGGPLPGSGTWSNIREKHPDQTVYISLDVVTNRVN